MKVHELITQLEELPENANLAIFIREAIDKGEILSVEGAELLETDPSNEDLVSIEFKW